MADQWHQYPIDLFFVGVDRIGGDDKSLDAVGVTAREIACQPSASRVSPHRRLLNVCGVQHGDEIGSHSSGFV